MANDDFNIALRWAQNVTGQTTKAIRNPSRSNVNPRGDQILSYGWWEMARLLRDAKGRPVRFLVNGDRYSNTTTGHQQSVRSAIAQTGLPSVIIPYTVLDNAGIDRDTIAPVEVTADRWVETVHKSTEFPAGAKWEYATDTVPGTGVYVHKVTGEALPDHGTHGPDGYTYEYQDRKRAAQGTTKWTVPDDDPASYKSSRAREQAFEAEWIHYEAVRKRTGRKVLKANARSWQDWEIVADDDPANPVGYSYTRTTQRHWLGESLVVATVRYRAVVKCTRCAGTGVADGDTIERRVNAEGPHRGYNAGSYLAPDWAWDDRPVYAWVKEPFCDQCGSRGRHEVNRTRRARFLSGFDRGEARESYFFCELPRTSKAKTVEEALEDLKPATVRTAETLGRTVKRQGDIFAVPLTLDTKALSTQGARRFKGAEANLLGTNHRATEVARIGSLTYARGTLRHDPEGRRPDHSMVKLGDGKTWHLILKNTVPVTV